MTIGIDASRANHTEKTGVEWYAFFVIQELKKILPEDTQVVLYSDIPLQGELANLPKNWSSKVLRWPPKRFWTQIRMSYEMLFHAPDILFIPAHVFPLIHPKKTLMTVHDVAAYAFPESYSWFEWWYSTWTAKYAVQKLWKVIVPSEFTKQEILQKTKKQKNNNIFVVHNGFDEKFLKQCSEEEIQNVLQKFSLQKPYLLSIGRLEEKKNTWRIIKAFEILKQQKQFQDYSLLLIGKPGHGYEKVEETFRQSSVKKDIFLPGWVGKDDLPALMQGAELFVFPSLYEGFGIPVLEALASGTPVLTSSGSSLKEVGGDTVFFVDPTDTESIAKNMVSALSSPEKDQKKQQGFIQIKAFSWKKCAQEISELFFD